MKLQLLLVILAIALPAIKVVEGIKCYTCEEELISDCKDEEANLKECVTDTEKVANCMSVEGS